MLMECRAQTYSRRWFYRAWVWNSARTFGPLIKRNFSRPPCISPSKNFGWWFWKYPGAQFWGIYPGSIRPPFTVYAGATGWAEKVRVAILADRKADWVYFSARSNARISWRHSCYGSTGYMAIHWPLSDNLRAPAYPRYAPWPTKRKTLKGRPVNLHRPKRMIYKCYALA